ncbi:MAG: helix-turn-helix domain-containing protein [Candidatus Limnocylindrales bacterium]
MEAAASLGVTAGTLRHPIATGRLKPVRHGRDCRVRRGAIERYRRESRGRPARRPRAGGPIGARSSGTGAPEPAPLDGAADACTMVGTRTGRPPVRGVEELTDQPHLQHPVPSIWYQPSGGAGHTGRCFCICDDGGVGSARRTVRRHPRRRVDGPPGPAAPAPRGPGALA